MKTLCKLALMGTGLSFVLACGGAGSNIRGGLSVTVSPSSFTMGVGSNLQFTATVSGTADQAVSWQVNQTPGGNASVGTIDSSGSYIAPVTPPASAVTVSAVAQADGTTRGSATIALTATDPVGSAQATAITCPSGKIQGGSCFSVVLSCPGIADFTAYVKKISPTGTRVGTVMFTGGGNGTGLYEDYTFGPTAVNDVVTGGFTAVETSFGAPFTDKTPNGWQTGPGGIRRVACRYATLAHWVYDNIHNKDATKPLCATGNSSGGQLIGESLAHYGTDSILAMVEPTSGPPFSDLEKACICGSDAGPVPGVCGGTVDQCLAPKDAEKFVDPAYSSPICSAAGSTHATTNQALFVSDSIQSPDATLDYPHTYIQFVYGGQDTSSAVTLGPDYEAVIKSSTPPAACVADAPHSIADVPDGAQQVANEILVNCRLH